MEIEADYKGYKQWKDGSRQHVLTEKGEGLIDVVRYMRDHLKYFGLENEFTFYEREIVQNRQDYVVTLRSKNRAGKNVIRPGVDAELESASKK